MAEIKCIFKKSNEIWGLVVWMCASSLQLFINKDKNAQKYNFKKSKQITFTAET